MGGEEPQQKEGRVPDVGQDAEMRPLSDAYKAGVRGAASGDLQQPSW